MNVYATTNIRYLLIDECERDNKDMKILGHYMQRWINKRTLK